MRAAQLALEQMATRDDIKENTIRIIDQCMQNPYENSKFCGNEFVCRSLFFASLFGRKDLVYNCFTSFRTVQDFWANFSNCLLLAIRFNHESLVDALISASDGALLAKGLRVLKYHKDLKPSVEKMVKQQLIQACVYDRKSILVTLVFVYSQCGLIDCSQDFTDMNSAFCQASVSGYNFIHGVRSLFLAHPCLKYPLMPILLNQPFLIKIWQKLLIVESLTTKSDRQPESYLEREMLIHSIL